MKTEFKLNYIEDKLRKSGNKLPSTEITFMILVDTSPQDLTLTKAFMFSANAGSDAAGGTSLAGPLNTTDDTLRISDYPRFIAEFVIIPRN